MASLPEDIANVEPLRPIRVLVASPDKRFLAAAAFFLTRRRFAVNAVRERDQVVRAVEDGDVDVVVLDASDSVAAAARTAGAIEGLRPHTRVILLSDDDALARDALPTLAKWGALGRLADAVVHAYGGAR